ncbi:DsrE/DsrF/DrsH-like family protein, partial [Bacillus subtilis]|uniref:DsrE/DsrF/DrsH-like family protein n=1 Tax=Bacillus subtilis TaxID=1423 RepID=UPI00338DD5AC
MTQQTKPTTILLFTPHYHKPIPPYIIPNPPPAYHHQLTIFHTFSPLNPLPKQHLIPIKEPFLQKIFPNIIPPPPHNIPLSKIN